MKFLTSTLARILFSVPFFGFGFSHFMNGQNMAASVPLPGGIFWIYLTGLAMILAGIAAVTKIKGKLAMLLLALLLFIYVISIHIPGMFNPQGRMFAIAGALKDIGLMGGALLLAGIFDSESKNETEIEAEIINVNQ